ncbi:TRAP transporter permease [Faunimonas sp. B44]|uniref:TRAP transporter permease n=1 Tax=Faunimonas sp. B44 TaxID=3461493 RepID=UPI0040445EDC
MTSVAQARSGPGKARRLLSAALLFAGITFILWTSLTRELPDLRQRAVIVALFVPLGLLLFPAKRPWGRLLDLVLMVGCVSGAAYVYFHYWDFMLRPSSSTALEATLGLIVAVTFLELARRCIGWSFAALALFFFGWLFVGQFVQGRMGHAPISWQLLADLMFRSTDGVWSGLIGLFSSLLAMFTLLSALMARTEVGQTFIDLAMLVGGRFKGGAAKIAVIASALVGSVNGSAPANVAMTGTFTIPMMKRFGFSPATAAAIEATASTGGQITPPLMGAGLFLMAEFLSVPVAEVMLAALLPAVIFFLGVLAAVHLHALKNDLGVLPAEEMPKASEVLRPRLLIPVIAPFAALLWLIVQGFPVAYSAAMAVLALVLAYLACAASWSEVKSRVLAIIAGLSESARPLTTLFVLVAAAGVLVAVLNFVGLPAKISSLLLGFAAGSLPVTLVLTGVVVVVLGMGMPTTAAYIVGASVAIAALIGLGIAPLPAHMFIFYMAALSAITPPVCAAVFVAAGIAEAPWGAVALRAVRLASVKYILPFAFVLHPALLVGDAQLWEVGLSFFLVLAAVLALSVALAGYFVRPLSLVERGLAALWAIGLLSPALLLQIGALAALIVQAIAVCAGLRPLPWRQVKEEPKS